MFIKQIKQAMIGLLPDIAKHEYENGIISEYEAAQRAINVLECHSISDLHHTGLVKIYEEIQTIMPYLKFEYDQRVKLYTKQKTIDKKLLAIEKKYN